MKITTYNQIIIAALALASVACTQNLEPGEAENTIEPYIGPAVLEATLNDHNTPTPEGRHNVDQTTDFWTTRSFSGGDRIGLFSTGGLVGPDGESQWILNEYMDYEQATGSSNYRFRNDNLLINTGMMGGKVGKYVYYPYTEDMPLPDPTKPSDYDSSVNKNPYYRGTQTHEKPGLYLRRKNNPDDPNDIDRCIDYMYINNLSLANGALSGGFYHGFCEMIIMRGEGFDKVPDNLKDSITIVLNSGVTRMKINAFMDNATGNFSWRPQLYYWSEDATTYGLSQEAARRWKAWQGKDYQDIEDGEIVEREAWYVILPTAHSYSYTSVSYIEIYNNDGEKCQVSNFDLYVNPETGIADKYMRNGKRYAVEVMMVEVGATVRPHKIEDWNEGEDGENDITDVRTASINNYSDFRNWVIDYNQFITQLNQHAINRPSTIEDAEKSPLIKYGDYDLDNKKWRFYITGKIDMPATGAVSIEELQDVLEGASQVENFKVNRLQSTFIKTIKEGGELRNLDFENLYVKPSSAYYHEETAGAIVMLLSGGAIRNCNIVDGTMIGNSTGTVGMLCGTVDGTSTITECTVTGAIVGTTYSDATCAEGLVGKVADTANLTYSKNDASGLIIKAN